MYSSINLSERKYMFLVNVHSYRDFTEKKTKRLAKFSFILKGQLIVILAQRVKSPVFNLVHQYCYFTHQIFEVFEIELCNFFTISQNNIFRNFS